jgi:hypothetical protein
MSVGKDSLSFTYAAADHVVVGAAGEALTMGELRHEALTRALGACREHFVNSFLTIAVHTDMLTGGEGVAFVGDVTHWLSARTAVGVLAHKVLNFAVLHVVVGGGGDYEDAEDERFHHCYY